MEDYVSSNNFMLTPPLEESNAALDDIDERNWDALASELMLQPPASLPPSQLFKQVVVEPFAETPKTPKKRGPRRKVAPHTTVATPNTRSHAHTPLPFQPPPTPRKPNSAPSHALISHSATHASSQRHIAFSNTATPDVLISPSSFSIEDLNSYVLDVFDSIISPLIPPPPEPTPSSHVIRRTLFRKQFSNETLTLIHHPSKPITSLDDLIPIIQIACASANLFLS